MANINKNNLKGVFGGTTQYTYQWEVKFNDGQVALLEYTTGSSWGHYSCDISWGNGSSWTTPQMYTSGNFIQDPAGNTLALDLYFQKDTSTGAIMADISSASGPSIDFVEGTTTVYGPAVNLDGIS